MCRKLSRVSLSFTCLLAASHYSWPAEPLLDRVRAGNQAALEAMRTVSFKFSIAWLSRKDPPTKGEYWRFGDSVRARWSSGERRVDVLNHDLVAKMLVTDLSPANQRIQSVTIAASQAGQHLGECDMWPYALMSLPGPKVTTLTFDELMKKPHTINRVRRETSNGRELVVVSLSHESTNLEIWFDPAANYLPRKLVAEAARPMPKPARGESEVIAFKEAAPGVYFPERIEKRYYYDDRLATHKEVIFADIQINKAISGDVFQFRIPAGANVVDTIQGKAYMADSQGQRVGAPIPLSSIPPLPAGTPGTQRAQRKRETSHEPVSATWWLLPASLGLLTLAGLLWTVRRWRGREA